MEAYFDAAFEDVRHERSLILLLSLTDRDLSKKNKYTDPELNIIANLDLECLNRVRKITQYFAIQLIEW